MTLEGDSHFCTELSLYARPCLEIDLEKMDPGDIGAIDQWILRVQEDEEWQRGYHGMKCVIAGDKMLIFPEIVNHEGAVQSLGDLPEEEINLIYGGRLSLIKANGEVTREIEGSSDSIRLEFGLGHGMQMKNLDRHRERLEKLGFVVLIEREDLV